MAGRRGEGGTGGRRGGAPRRCDQPWCPTRRRAEPRAGAGSVTVADRRAPRPGRASAAVRDAARRGGLGGSGSGWAAGRRIEVHHAHEEERTPPVTRAWPPASPDHGRLLDRDVWREQYGYAPPPADEGSSRRDRRADPRLAYRPRTSSTIAVIPATRHAMTAAAPGQPGEQLRASARSRKNPASPTARSRRHPRARPRNCRPDPRALTTGVRAEEHRGGSAHQHGQHSAAGPTSGSPSSSPHHRLRSPRHPPRRPHRRREEVRRDQRGQRERRAEERRIPRWRCSCGTRTRRRARSCRRPPMSAGCKRRGDRTNAPANAVQSTTKRRSTRRVGLPDRPIDPSMRSAGAAALRAAARRSQMPAPKSPLEQAVGDEPDEHHPSTTSASVIGARPRPRAVRRPLGLDLLRAGCCACGRAAAGRRRCARQPDVDPEHGPKPRWSPGAGLTASAVRSTP